MRLVGRLDFARPDRVSIDRAGTLRDIVEGPVDVVIDNLSRTGCLFAVDRDLAHGASISIGIPGVGIRHARVSRGERPHYGCAFLSPVSDAEIGAARSAETIVRGAFPQVRRPGGQAVDEDSSEVRWPRPWRIATIVGASILLWALIVAGVLLLLRV